MLRVSFIIIFLRSLRLKCIRKIDNRSEGSLPCPLLMHLHMFLSSHLEVCSCLGARLLRLHKLMSIILPKIILAGFHVLQSSACVAELSWACGRVVHHVLGFRKVLAKLGRICILHVRAFIPMQAK